MIKYKTAEHDNIYLADGYKVYTQCIQVFEVEALHEAIDWSIEHGYFKPDARNVFELHVYHDKFIPNQINKEWYLIGSPKVLLAGC